jgi:hypothetical protein
MAVIKALEKTCMIKDVGIPGYYLGVNVEFLGKAWKNQASRLAHSTKTYLHSKRHSEI